MGMDKKIKKKSWLYRNIGYVIVGSIVTVLLIIIVFFSDHTSKLNINRETIDIEPVISSLFQDYITVNGQVEPIRTVSLLPLVSGKVIEKLKEEGDTVKIGDVILKLSNPELEQMINDFETEYEKEKINVEQSILNLEKSSSEQKTQILEMQYAINNEKRNFEEKKYEFEMGMIPKNTFLMAEESYELAIKKREMLIQNMHRDSLATELNIRLLRRGLKQKKNSFILEKNKLEDLKVKAPVDGYLSSLINVELGGQVSENNGIGYIRDLSDLKLVALIDEHYSRRIFPNLKATCTIGDKTYELVVKKVSLEVINGQIQSELLFYDEKPDMIRVGQTYRINLQLGQSKQAILIPRGAFYQNTGGQWIYILDSEGEYAYKKEIQIGRQNPKYYEVLGGLDVGDKVVISSYSNFGDVDKLLIKE